MNNPWPKPRWLSRNVIWSLPDYPAVRLVRISTRADLNLWARLMGHSGARYDKWVIDERIWHFLTFLDENDNPHVTIHAKDVAWLDRKHPDDRFAVREQAWPYGYGPAPLDSENRARLWLTSTLYDNVSKRYPYPVMLDGKACVIMAAGHRDADPL